MYPDSSQHSDPAPRNHLGRHASAAAPSAADYLSGVCRVCALPDPDPDRSGGLGSIVKSSVSMKISRPS